MNTILRSGDKVRVVMDESGHGFSLFSIVTLKDRNSQLKYWTVEGSNKIIWENEVGVACLRCQPGGCFTNECTCRVLMCGTCAEKARGFLDKCLKCGGTLYPEDELLKKLINQDVHIMKIQLESITLQLADIKNFFDKGDFLRVATRADELSGACTRLFNMAYQKAFPKG